MTGVLSITEAELLAPIPNTKNYTGGRKHPEWESRKCYYCRRRMHYRDARRIPSAEHPQPKSKGGMRIVPACLYCNIFKQMMTEKQFRFLADLLDYDLMESLGEAVLRNQFGKKAQKFLKDHLASAAPPPRNGGLGFFELITRYSLPAVKRMFKIRLDGRWSIR